MPINITMPNSTGIIGYLNWTNTFAGSDFAFGLLVLFFGFLLPLMYLVSLGVNKTDALFFTSIIVTILFWMLGLVNLVPNIMFLGFVVFTGIIAMYHVFRFGTD